VSLFSAHGATVGDANISGWGDNGGQLQTPVMELYRDDRVAFWKVPAKTRLARDREGAATAGIP